MDSRIMMTMKLFDVSKTADDKFIIATSLKGVRSFDLQSPHSVDASVASTLRQLSHSCGDLRIQQSLQDFEDTSDVASLQQLSQSCSDIPTTLEAVQPVAESALAETPLVADVKHERQFKLTPSRSCDDFMVLPTFCSSDFSFAGINEKEEAEWFDFLSTQLSQKNINPDSDTCSMIGFDELLRMKKKSSLDSRATIHHQTRDRTVAVVATPEPTADQHNTPVHHPQGGRTLTPTRSCNDLVGTPTFSSSDFPFAGSNEKEEAEWFDFLSTQLSQKNINPDSDTCSMIGFDELLRMKKKSSLDSRDYIYRINKIVVLSHPSVATDSTPEQHTQGGSKWRRTLLPFKRVTRQLRKLLCWKK